MHEKIIKTGTLLCTHKSSYRQKIFGNARNQSEPFSVIVFGIFTKNFM